MIGLSLFVLVQATPTLVPVEQFGSARNGDAIARRYELTPRELRDALSQRGQVGSPVSEGSLSPCSTLVGGSAPASFDVEGDQPVAAAFSPDGARLVVAHRATQNLTVFDVQTLDFEKSIDVPGMLQDLAIASDGGVGRVEIRPVELAAYRGR